VLPLYVKCNVKSSSKKIYSLPIRWNINICCLKTIPKYLLKMEVLNFLRLVDSLCVLNVFYNDQAEVNFLQHNTIPATVYKTTSLEVVEFAFYYRSNMLAQISDGYSDKNCLLSILILNENTYLTAAAKGYEQRLFQWKTIPFLKYFIPKRSYVVLFLETEHSVLVNKHVSQIFWYEEFLPANFIITFYKSSELDNCYCVVPVQLDHNLGLTKQIKCTKIYNYAISGLDNIFNDRVTKWKVIETLPLDNQDAFSNPVKALPDFDITHVLKQMQTKAGLPTVSTSKYTDVVDIAYIHLVLNILALENTTGLVTKFHELSDRNENYDDFRMGEFSYPHAEMVFYSYDWKMTDSTELEALTCFTQPVLSIRMYSNPFSAYLWLSLLITIVVLSTLLTLYVHYYHKQVSSSISSILFSLSLLSNVSYYIPSPVWHSGPFMWTYSFWMLTTMILSNYYQSLVITELNAPMRGRELENVSKYTICENNTAFLGPPPFKSVMEAVEWHNKTRYKFMFEGVKSGVLNPQNILKAAHEENKRHLIPNCFALLSEPHYEMDKLQFGLNTVNDFYILYHQALIGEEHGSMRFFLVSPMLRLYPLDPQLKESDGVYLEREAAIEKELIMCEKSVYIASKETIKSEISYLQANHKRIRFYKRKQYLVRNNKITGWMFSYHKNSKLPVYLNRYFESGIPRKLKQFASNIRLLWRRVGSQVVRSKKPPVQPIKLSDSVHTVFILFMFINCLTSIILFLEIWKKSSYSFLVFGRKTSDARFKRFVNSGWIQIPRNCFFFVGKLLWANWLEVTSSKTKVVKF